jgi:hypothetical protein
MASEGDKVVGSASESNFTRQQENSNDSSTTKAHLGASGASGLESDKIMLPFKNDSDAEAKSTDFRANSSSQSSISSPANVVDVHQRTLLEEIREVLAQSYLIFLVADLRLLSGTGRICTLYEHLAIDSDVYPRNTAAQLACLVHPRGDEEEKSEETPYSQEIDKSTMVATCPEQPTKSLSPANIMAILLLEIRDTFAHSSDSDKNPEVGEALMTYRGDKAKRRNLEDSMASLLRAYARMISEDLVTEIPNVRRRRMSMTHSFTTPNSRPQSTRNQSMEGPERTSMIDSQPQLLTSTVGLASIVEETSVELDGDNVPVAERYSSSIDLPNAQPKSDSKPIVSVVNDAYTMAEKTIPELQDNTSETTKAKPLGPVSRDEKTLSGNPISDSESSADKKAQKRGTLMHSPHTLFSSSRREQLVHQVSQRKLQLAEDAKLFAAQMNKTRQTVIDRVDPNREGNVKKEFQELTHALFEDGGEHREVRASDGGSIATGDMLSVMRSAIETRNDGQLQFLSRLFRDGSVSRLLVESHSRLLWINDWYPLKDLTYAIAVDTRLKRVLVVFRGASTVQDWKMGMKNSMQTIANPVKDDFVGKKEKIRVFSGFYHYLFRMRKDTGTTKYSEIARLAHKYGMEKIGKDYKLFVTGHSLGGALTNIFCFFASTEERFTRNGPVQAIAFAGPYSGGHSFADSFRHQERKNKLQFVRLSNNWDMIPRLPTNFRIGRRGCRWRHVGIGVTMPGVPLFGKWKPLVHYYGKEKSWFGSTLHGYRRNFIFHTPFLRPWIINQLHTLFELQHRLMYGQLQSNPGGDFPMLNQTMDELYEGLQAEDFQRLKGTKTNQAWH